MTWYVFYDYGSCNYGDHSCGLDACDTEDAARNRVREVIKRDPDATCIIIQGEVLKTD